MDDLGIYDRLARGETRPEDAPALAALAALPLERRLAIFGVLDRVLVHPSPALRAAALGVLAGADGRVAFADELRLLSDADLGVVAAAVNALRQSAEPQPLRWTRWAHALFHPRAEVRGFALAEPAPAGAEWLEPYLLADPIHASALLARVGDASRPLRLDKRAVVLILTLEQRRLVTPQVALDLLERIDADDVLGVAASGAARPTGTVKEILERLARPAVVEKDGLDVLFDLLLRAPVAAGNAMFRAFEAALPKLDLEAQRRVAASLVLAAGATPRAELLRLLVLLHPATLGWQAVGSALRREAALALLDAAKPPRLERESVEALLGELAVDGGSVALSVAAALLRVLEEPPYALLVDVLGWDALSRAFALDPFAGAPLLSLHDDSKRGRAWFFRELALRAKVGEGLLHALAVWTLPNDRLDFVDALDPHQSLALAFAIADIEADPRVELRPKKRVQVAARVAERIVNGGSPELARRAFTRLLSELLVRGTPSDFGVALVGEIGQRLAAEPFVDAVRALGDARLPAALALVSSAARVPFGKELALAHALGGHASPEVRRWVEERAPEKKTVAIAVSSGPARELDATEVALLGRVSHSDLEREARRLTSFVHLGLTRALERRPAPPGPSAIVCLALLGSADPPDAVTRELVRFGSDDPGFLAELDRNAVDTWSGVSSLPLVGASWLWRWERQAFRIGELLEATAGGAPALLSAAVTWSWGQVRENVFLALGRLFHLWAAREPAKLRHAVAGSAAVLVELAVDELGSDVGLGAAEILGALHAGGFTEVAEARERIRGKIPDLAQEVRARLERIVSAAGVAVAGGVAKRRDLDERERASIRAQSEIDILLELCQDANPARVEEAVLRLIELGKVSGLAQLLACDPPLPGLAAIAESVSLWPEGPELDSARAISAPLHSLFRISLALAARGEAGRVEVAVGAALAPVQATWFRSSDWEKLGVFVAPPELARRLAISPHPHAYRRAVETLLAEPGLGALPALRTFLGCGTERQSELRLGVAEHLHARGDDYGFPLRFTHALGGGSLGEPLFARVSDERIEQAVLAVVRAGPRASREARLCDLLEQDGPSREARLRAYELLLTESTNIETARKASWRLMRFEARAGKLRRVAQVFAWGGRIAPVLTGRRLRVHMTDGRALGYTRLEESRVYVSPLPILRGDQNARAVVEGLVLHELGHHRHHRGPEALAIWKKAEEERIHGLLNLVADEHLERNLRALDDGFGDRLKLLAAHAFQHADREVSIRALVGLLGTDSFAVLSSSGLDLAYRLDAVRVRSGALLAQMERAGSSFARFFRALRMGLGNRHEDPLVAEALALFDRKFRHLEMPALLELARRLHAIFGWDAALADAFGGHEIGAEAERDHGIHGESLTDEEVQQEVERVTDPERFRAGRSGGGSGKPGRLQINVSGAPHFERITEVKPLMPDPIRHRELAREISRHARRLRAVLEQLGLARVPERRRLAGTRVDSSSLERLVLHGDPRILVRREIEVDADLFVGVVVDCSGSMQTGHSMEKARRFAVLLAEAARDLPGVDLRVFGFTDQIIYDAGNARRCAAASLEAGGGNNDAAGLLFAAEFAKKSRRSGKLLVMVSDGLPTECSTEALKGLVQRLERREHMVVAQVAVRPLEEQCFRHYVLLEGDDLDRAVGQFGKIVVKLVKRALA